MKIFAPILAIFFCVFNLNAQLGDELIQLYEGHGMQLPSIFEKTSDNKIICATRNIDDVENGSGDYIVIREFDENFGMFWEYIDSTQYEDHIFRIIETDAGYLNLSRSADWDVDNQEFIGCAIKLSQLDYQGNLIWEQCYELDFIWARDILYIGNKIVLLATSSQGNEFADECFSKFYVFDTDGNFEGEHLYQNAISGYEYVFNSLAGFEKVNENEFYVTGFTRHASISGSKHDYLILKYQFNNGGFNLVKGKTYGSDNDDLCVNRKLLSNGNLVVNGFIKEAGGDVIASYQSYDDFVLGRDAWLICLDSDLEIVWQRTVGGTDNDQLSFLHVDEHDNIFLSGSTESKDYDCSNWIHYADENNTFRIPAVFKLNSKGDLLWSYIHGEGSGGTTAYTRILKIGDDLFMMTGQNYTEEPNFACPFVTPQYGYVDYYFSKLIGGVNTIIVNCFYDLNQNGVKEIEELPFDCDGFTIAPNVIRSLQYGGSQSIYNVSKGSYSVSYEREDWGNSTSLPEEIVFVAEDSLVNLTLGLYPLFTAKTFEVEFTEGPMVCNSSFNFWVDIKNTGTSYLDGNIIIDFSPLLSFDKYIANSLGDITLVDSLENIYAIFENLPPFTQSSIQFIFNSPSEQEIGEIVTLNATVEVGDVTDGHNVYEEFYEFETLCSYDPNDKLVEPSLGHKNYALIDGGLLYTIRFQNTGNYPAQKVVIRDTINQLLDLNDLRIVSSSHEMVAHITPSTRVIEFTFDDIWLIDSLTNEPLSHGFVKFFINPIEGVTDYTEVRNRAGIFFDNNPPIITNNLLSTLVHEYPKPAMDFFENNAENFDELFTDITALIDKDILISPNPFNNFLIVEVGIECQLNIYNVNGKLLFNSQLKQSNTIDTSYLSEGFYIVEIRNKNGETYYQKIVKTNH